MLFIRKSVGNLFKSHTPQIASDPSEPCDICFCYWNRTTICIQQRCLPREPGCQPVFAYGLCCPLWYNCSGEFIIPGDNIVVIPLLREVSRILSRQI